MVLATIKGANGSVRLSAYTLQKALLFHYTQNKLFPSGIYADIPSVQEWALKYAVAIKKLVPLLCLMAPKLVQDVFYPKVCLRIFDFSMQTKFEPEDFQCLGFQASTYDATIEKFKEQETHTDQTACPAAWMGPCCKVCNGS